MLTKKREDERKIKEAAEVDEAIAEIIAINNQVLTTELGNVYLYISRETDLDWKQRAVNFISKSKLESEDKSLLSKLIRNLPAKQEEATARIHQTLLKLGWENEKARFLEILSWIKECGIKSRFVQDGAVLNASQSKSLRDATDSDTDFNKKAVKNGISSAVKKLISDDAGYATNTSYLGKKITNDSTYVLMQTNNGEILVGDINGDSSLISKEELNTKIAKIPKVKNIVNADDVYNSVITEQSINNNDSSNDSDIIDVEVEVVKEPESLNVPEVPKPSEKPPETPKSPERPKLEQNALLRGIGKILSQHSDKRAIGATFILSLKHYLEKNKASFEEVFEANPFLLSIGEDSQDFQDLLILKSGLHSKEQLVDLGEYLIAGYNNGIEVEKARIEAETQEKIRLEKERLEEKRLNGLEKQRQIKELYTQMFNLKLQQLGLNPELMKDENKNMGWMKTTIINNSGDYDERKMENDMYKALAKELLGQANSQIAENVSKKVKENSHRIFESDRYTETEKNAIKDTYNHEYYNQFVKSLSISPHAKYILRSTILGNVSNSEYSITKLSNELKQSMEGETKQEAPAFSTTEDVESNKAAEIL